MKNKQSGGVVSFVVIAAVLAGLLAGGLYFSKHQARVAREGDRTTPTVVTDTKEGKQDGKKPDVATRNDVPAGAGTSDEAKKGETDASTTQRGEAKPPVSPRVAVTGPSEQIPETGAADAFAGLAAVVSLVFAGGAALQARRRVARTALR